MKTLSEIKKSMKTRLHNLKCYIKDVCPECGQPMEMLIRGFDSDPYCPISPRRECSNPRCDYRRHPPNALDYARIENS